MQAGKIAGNDETLDLVLTVIGDFSSEEIKLRVAVAHQVAGAVKSGRANLVGEVA